MAGQASSHGGFPTTRGEGWLQGAGVFGMKVSRLQNKHARFRRRQLVAQAVPVAMGLSLGKVQEG